MINMKYKIQLKNGVFDVEQDKFIINKETDNILSFNIIYDPEAQCPKIDKFLREIFNSEDLELIYEIIAYVMLPTIHYQKAFLLYGSGSNGKTTFLDLICEFIGWDYCSNVDVFRSDTITQLQNKLLNRIDDFPFFNPFDSIMNGNFKRVISNNILTAEYMHTYPFDFKNMVKIIITANYKPKIEALSIKRKILFLEMNNKIVKPIPNLINHLSDKKEFSGLFNHCINAIGRLNKNNSRLGH